MVDRELHPAEEIFQNLELPFLITNCECYTETYLDEGILESKRFELCLIFSDYDDQTRPFLMEDLANGDPTYSELTEKIKDLFQFDDQSGIVDDASLLDVTKDIIFRIDLNTAYHCKTKEDAVIFVNELYSFNDDKVLFSHLINFEERQSFLSGIVLVKPDLEPELLWRSPQIHFI